MNQEDQLSVLSEEELLSQLVPQETAKGLLQSYSSLYNLFLHISPRQMQEIKGVGEAKLKRLLCVREVMTRMQQYRTRTVRVVHGPEDVIKYFRYLEDRQQEELWLLMLNTKNHIIGSQQISVGTINASLVSPREVFHAAIQSMAASVIVVHNHPSGDSSPSSEDRAVTERMVRCGKVMDIPVLDHIIIARHGGYSMKEHMDSVWRK